MADAIQAFARHVAGTRFEDLPAPAVRAAKIFILDTFGVGIAGSTGPYLAELIASQRAVAGDGPARIWGQRGSMAASGAALINGYQIHNSEFDCVHEAAVIHPMTVAMAAVTAHADSAGGVSGRDLILAAALGVDVACHLGVATSTGLRFFRPATAGGMAAAAALGRLRGFDEPTQAAAFGHAFGQLCGTMQAHTEGAALLGMQIGFNARNALLAADLAARGIPSIDGVLEGPFGYYPMIELAHELEAVLPLLGTVWRIAEVAHKPFPSGRATHGMLDGVMELQREHGFAAGEVATVTARVPSLTHHLIGRPSRPRMAVNYARLCGAYVAACALLRGELGLDDFTAARRHDPETLDLAGRIAVEVDDNPDPNALHPVSVEVALRDGRWLKRRIEQVYGNPAKPMSREAHLAKFRRNWAGAAAALPAEDAERMIALVDDLEAVEDIRVLTAMMAG